MLRLNFSTIDPKARRNFTGIMTCFAVPFGTAVASWRLKGQLDLTADLFKIAICLALLIAVLSFISWTVMTRSKLTKFRGSVAGFMTALLTIPAPFAVSGFRQGFLESYVATESGIFSSILNGIGVALFKAFYIFEDMTKMSLLALLSSLCVGFMVAHWAMKRQDEASHTVP